MVLGLAATELKPRNRWPPATCYTAERFSRCAERKWLVVVRQCKPLNLDVLFFESCELSLATLVSCDLCLDPAAQPRNHWPTATCYTAERFSRCAERKWLVVVRQCRPLNLDALFFVSCELSLATLVSCDLCLDPAAQPRNHWPPATCYTADGSRWCAERKWLMVVPQCRPLNLDALILVSSELGLDPAALPRSST
jgi:putative hemolysin